MAKENEVELTIVLNAEDAEAAIGLFGNSVKKTVAGVEKGFSNIGDSFKDIGSNLKSSGAGIAGSFANILGPGVLIGIGAVVTGFSAISNGIEEAAKQALQLKQISAALQATNENSIEAVQAVNEFADSIRAASTLDDDFVKQLFISAKAFGTTSDQAQKLTKAAIELSAATGLDVNTALKQLGGTLDGSAGRINNLGKEFRNLSAEQLKAGAALDLVIKKYGGAAAAEIDTYSGATTRLSRAFEDLQKTVGASVANDKGIIRAKNSIADFIDGVSEFIKGGNDVERTAKVQEKLAAESVKRLEELGQTGQSTLPRVQNVLDVISNSDTGKSTEGLRSFQTVLEDIAKIKPYSGLVGKEAEDARKKFDELTKGLEKAGLSELEIANQVKDQRLKIFDDLKNTGVASEQELINAKIKINQDYKLAIEKQFDEINKITESSDSPILKEARKAGEALAKLDKLAKITIGREQEISDKRAKIIENFNDFALNETQARLDKEEALYKSQLERLKAQEKDRIDKSKAAIAEAAANPIVFSIKTGKEKTGGEVAGATVGGLNSVLGGKEGARSLIANTYAGVADLLLPGIGQAVGPLVSALSQGPENAKAMVTAFVESVPDIINAIAESIPVVVSTLIDTLITKGGIFKIAAAFVKSTVLLMPMVGKAIVDSLVAGAPLLGKNIADGFKFVFGDLFSGISNALQPLVEGFRSIFQPIADAFQNASNAISFSIDRLSLPFEILTNSINSLVSPIQSLIDALNKAGSTFGKGGGKGVISETGSKIAKAIGFADGGQLPMISLPNGDKLLAGFNPGELVIPTDTVGQLKNFLDSQQTQGAGDQSTAILAAILAAVQQPMVVQAEAKVNQNAFADIILQLNRNNARLSA